MKPSQYQEQGFEKPEVWVSTKKCYTDHQSLLPDSFNIAIKLLFLQGKVNTLYTHLSCQLSAILNNITPIEIKTSAHYKHLQEYQFVQFVQVLVQVLVQVFVQVLVFINCLHTGILKDSSMQTINKNQRNTFSLPHLPLTHYWFFLKFHLYPACHPFKKSPAYLPDCKWQCEVLHHGPLST